MTEDDRMNRVVSLTAMIVVNGDGHETVRSHRMDDERLYPAESKRGDCYHKGGLSKERGTTKPLNYTKNVESPNPGMV